MRNGSDLKVIQSGGASLIQRCPLFSSDSRYLFCTSGSEVKVFSITSGECVHRLIGHEQQVTGVAQHPKIKLQIISTSLDSTLKIWDYEDGVLIKSIPTGCPLYCLFTHASFAKHIYVIQQKDEIYQLSRILTKDVESTGRTDSKPYVDIEVLLDDVGKPVTKSVRFLSSGIHIACCKRKTLCVVNANDPTNRIVEHVSDGDGHITCISCHPTSNCCVTGHTSGKIKFWHNIYSIEDAPKGGTPLNAVVVSTQHWHSGCVEDICFTPGGSSILSVGKEGVLVQWQYLESGSKKNFFPRLGASLRHIVIAGDGSLYATTHIDNSVSILSNLFIVRQTIEGFTSSRHLVKSLSDREGKIALPCNLRYDWKTRSCVTNGKPGHLLFYRPYSDTQLYNLDISHQNHISGDLEGTVITNVSLSPEPPSLDHITGLTDQFKFGTWMATIEERDDGVTSREQKLKIWLFDETKQWWKLNTIINAPHDLHVTRLVFRPFLDAGTLQPALLSTSLDGMAKLWTPAENIGAKGFGFWSCEVATSYRQLAACDGAFSQDGSLSALGFENVVCLSDPDTLEDMTVFLDLPETDKIRFVLFGRNSCEYILMVATGNCMRACDLLSGSVLWSVELNPFHLLCDPLSDVMAVFTEDDHLHIFRPCEPSPLHTHTKVTLNAVLGAAFFPCVKKSTSSWMSADSKVEWMQESRLFFVSSKMTVHTLCTVEESEKRNSAPNYMKISTDDKSKLHTPLASILTKSNVCFDKKQNSQDLASTTTTLPHGALLKALKQITDTPSHVMPPFSILCQTFLSSLLVDKLTKANDLTMIAQDASEMGGIDWEFSEEHLSDVRGSEDSELDKIDANSLMWASEAFSN